MYEAQVVEPNAAVQFNFEVKGITPQLFYLLLEINLFIDGCWNWFGITWRAQGMRTWIDSELYQRTLPHTI